MKSYTRFCVKCGGGVSHNQKYCYDCSPDKLKIKGCIDNRICIKCGVQYPPNSVRQKYCTSCSPHIRSNNPKIKTRCCHCNRLTPKKHTKPYREKGLVDGHYPRICESCIKIKDRQKIASEVRSKRIIQKWKTRHGKVLIEESEKHTEEHGRPLFDPLRWVSANEIEWVKKMQNLDEYCHKEHYSMYVYYERYYYDPVGWLRKPGFYRVSYDYAQYDPPLYNFSTNCESWFLRDLAWDEYKRLDDDNKREYREKRREAYWKRRERENAQEEEERKRNKKPVKMREQIYFAMLAGADASKLIN